MVIDFGPLIWAVYRDDFSFRVNEAGVLGAVTHPLHDFPFEVGKDIRRRTEFYNKVGQSGANPHFWSRERAFQRV